MKSKRIKLAGDWYQLTRTNKHEIRCDLYYDDKFDSIRSHGDYNVEFVKMLWDFINETNKEKTNEKNHLDKHLYLMSGISGKHPGDYH